jgi:hypothetical protein
MNEIIKEYIHQASCKIVINKLQRIGIESIHIKWMNEIMKKYICWTSCKIIVDMLKKYE